MFLTRRAFGIASLFGLFGGAAHNTSRLRYSPERDLSEFCPGDILLWDWDNNELVLLGPVPTDIWQRLDPEPDKYAWCGHTDYRPQSPPYAGAAQLDWKQGQHLFQFHRVPTSNTIYRTATVIDWDTGERLPEVLSYHAVTHECVRIATYPYAPHGIYDPVTRIIRRIYERRRLQIIPQETA